MAQRKSVAPDAPGNPLELVLDDIEDYAIFLLDLDLKIVSWNAGAQRLKGYTPAEAIGQPFAMLFTPEDAAAGQPEREGRIARERGVYQGEGVRRRKGGELFDAEVTLRLIRDEEGEPRGFLKVTRDITERKELERAALERADLEKQLIGIVSHDLRSPLSAILLSATLMLRRDDLDGRQTRAISSIVSSAERSLRMVGDLLDFTQARLGGGLSVRPTEFDVDQFVGLVGEEVQAGHPERQILIEHASGGTVCWDADRIAQLVTNLVTNAVTHGASDQPVRITTRAEGDSVVICVHNFGEPIAPALLPHIFERLTRASRAAARPGSIGLGLFIASHIARAHGGTIDVESTAEKGTTFSARMPRKGPVAPAQVKNA